MKNILSLLLLLVAVSATAQSDAPAASTLLGGSLQFNYQRGSVSNFRLVANIPGLIFAGSSERIFTNLNVHPYFAKRVSDRWWLGVAAEYQRSSFRPTEANSIASTAINNDFGLDLWSRYLFNPGADFQVFLQPTVGYFSTSSRSETTQTGETVFEGSGDYFRLLVTPGITYALSPRFAFLANFGNLYFLTGTDRADSQLVPNATEENPVTSLGVNLRLSSFALGAELRF